MFLLLLIAFLSNVQLMMANNSREYDLKEDKSISIQNIEERIDKADFYYKNNALFLAVEELSFLKFQSFKYAKDSIQMLIGEAYQLLNHIYHDIGYVNDIKQTADSMFFYKSLASDHDPQFKVEYLTYLSRYHALEMKTKHSNDDMLEAIKVLRTLDNTNNIDINYFYLNYLNTARNRRNLLLIESPIFKYPEDESVNSHQINLIEICDSLINTLDFKTEKWYNIIFYYKVRNNLHQDMNMRFARQYDSNNVANNSFHEQYFQDINSLKEIKPKKGVPQNQMLAVKGLQYTYYKDYCKAKEYYAEALKNFSIKVDSHYYFRSIITPLMVLKWYNNASQMCEDGLKKQTLDSILHLNLKAERIYNQYLIHYLKPETEYISLGYMKSPYEQILSISYQLYSLTHDKKYLKTYWHYANKARYTSLYFKLCEETDSKELKKVIRALDRLNTSKFILLDKLYLSREGLILFDTVQIKTDIENNNNKYDELIKSTSPAIQALFGTQSLVSIDSYIDKLEKDEAVLLYTNHKFQDRAPNYVIVLKKGFSEIIGLVQDTLDSRRLSYLNEDIINNPKTFQEISYHISRVYFQPILKNLNGIKKIKIIASHKIDYLPFDILIEDTLANPHYKDFKFYGLSYNFTYIPNTYVEYLFENRIHRKSDSILIFSPDYKNKTIANKLPFNNILGNSLESKQNALLIKNSNDLTKLHTHSSYKYIHIAAHGIVDYDRVDIIAKYNTKSNYKLYLNDTLIGKDFFNTRALKTDLSVVASCRAGFSLYDYSDGKIGMIRTLYLSGSNAVITTPWRLDDQSSAQILSAFYNRIESGEPYSEALWNAKKDFLSNAKDPQLFNPIYWAALNYHGIDSKIDQSNSKKSGVGLLIILIGGVLIYSFSRIKRAS